MNIQTMAEIIDEFRNLYENKDEYHSFFDGAYDEELDPSEIEELKDFVNLNKRGIYLSNAFLFCGLTLEAEDEKVIDNTFNQLCALFDSDPNNENYEDLADVVSAGD